MDGCTEEKQRRFIEVLADTGLASGAAKSVGMSRERANRLRRSAHGAAFSRAPDAARAHAGGGLEDIASERAIEGREHNVYDECDKGPPPSAALQISVAIADVSLELAAVGVGGMYLRRDTQIAVPVPVRGSDKQGPAGRLVVDLADGFGSLREPRHAFTSPEHRNPPKFGLMGAR